MGNLAYQEDFRDEMLDGRIVLMSPRPAVNHNIVVGNIFRVFSNFLQGNQCSAFVDGVDVYLTEKDRVIPDIMIVCNENIIKKNGIYGTPDLIVEVLSPSTAKKDKGYKKKLYEKCGVKEYWLVEPETRSIEVYLLKDKKFELEEIYTIYPDYIIEKMSETEKENIIYEFAPTLFPEMTIVLEKVFEKMR